MRGHFLLPGSGGSFLSSCTGLLAFAFLFVLAPPSSAQVLDLDADLAALLSRLNAVPSSASTTDRLDNLDDVAARLLAPDGLLSDISAEIGSQGHLLDAQAGDLAALRVDLSSLRSAVDLGNQNQTDLTDLRATVGTHTTTLAEHERRIDQNSTDIATLNGRTNTLSERTVLLDERTTLQGKDIQKLNGDVAKHETRISALETAVGEDLSAQNAKLDDLGRRLNSRMDRMDDRIDTANEGVAMALALKSPYVPEDKSFALSGGWGNFEGENAFGMSGAVRAGRSLQLDAGVAVGADQGSVGGRAGATLTW